MVPNCDILLLFIHCCLLYEPVQRAALGSKRPGSAGTHPVERSGIKRWYGIFG